MHAPAETDRWRFGIYLFIFAISVGALIALDVSHGEPHNLDPDDGLRALEVRTLLATGRWFDMSIPVVWSPEPYFSHWSRIIDLPYVAIALALKPFLGLEQALSTAFRVWPGCMACLYVTLVTAISQRLAPSRSDFPSYLIPPMVSVAVYGIWEFSPGRIDHHNAQILCLLLAIYGFARFDARGGLLIGVAVCVATAIGLETLPVLAVALVAISASWWFDMPASRRVLQATGAVCAILPVLLMLALIAPSDYFVLHADEFSAPYIEALAGFGLLAILVPHFLGDRKPPLVRFAIFAGVGIAVIAAILLQYPDYLKGPYPMMDAVAKKYWFDRILQEKSVLVILEWREPFLVIMVTIPLLLLILSAPAVVRDIRHRRPGLPAIFAMLCCALLLSYITNRFLPPTLATSILLAPVAFGEARRMLVTSRTRTLALARAVGTMVVLVVAFEAFFAVLPPPSASKDAFDDLLVENCRRQDFSILADLTPGHIMTPPGIGLEIARRASPGITVSSIPYHRNTPAISRVTRTFMASTTEERMAYLKGFDYLALCRPKTPRPGGQSLSLFNALIAGAKVPGFDLVQAPVPTQVMVFRIDHSVTQ
jgi:hypothetical protein